MCIVGFGPFAHFTKFGPSTGGHPVKSSAIVGSPSSTRFTKKLRLGKKSDYRTTSLEESKYLQVPLEVKPRSSTEALVDSERGVKVVPTVVEEFFFSP